MINRTFSYNKLGSRNGHAIQLSYKIHSVFKYPLWLVRCKLNSHAFFATKIIPWEKISLSLSESSSTKTLFRKLNSSKTKRNFFVCSLPMCLDNHVWLMYLTAVMRLFLRLKHCSSPNKWSIKVSFLQTVRWFDLITTWNLIMSLICPFLLRQRSNILGHK